MDATASFYSRPVHGAGLPIYAGSRRQRGGSVLGALARTALPVLKRLGRQALKTATRHGIGMAKDVMLDTLAGHNIKDSLKERGKQHLKTFGTRLIGDALRRAKNPATKVVYGTTKPKPKLPPTRPLLRKRKNATKKGQPVPKRRRRNF